MNEKNRALSTVSLAYRRESKAQFLNQPNANPFGLIGSSSGLITEFKKIPTQNDVSLYQAQIQEKQGNGYNNVELKLVALTKDIKEGSRILEAFGAEES